MTQLVNHLQAVVGVRVCMTQSVSKAISFKAWWQGDGPTT